MASREYGVDVAAYQPTSMTSYHDHGAKFMVVKLSEGTSYFNPKAHYQISSAHSNHMWVHAYHFATFGNSVSRAKSEAKYFISRAKAENISKKRYLWLDWETGDGNWVTSSTSSNTSAIIAFMSVCYDAGYKVGLYSGASILRNNVDTKRIISKYGNCLWVASYTTMGRIDTPNFGYFPSMDGVAIWQFTDNWKGLNVDGNISLIELEPDRNKAKLVPKKSAPVKKTASKPSYPSKVYVPVLYGNPNYHVRLLDSKGKYQQYIATNTTWKVWGVKTIKGMKCYKIGTDKQYLPAKFTK